MRRRTIVLMAAYGLGALAVLHAIYNRRTRGSIVG